jgi:O-succinylbenzoic acid--CoA ligase
MAQGELCIIGRMDNLFFCGGENVQPEDIERILAAHPQVLQSVIVPIDDPEFGQRPVAVLDLTEQLTLADLLIWTQDRLAHFQQPVALLSLPEEFKLGGIKISRRQLQHWAAEQLGAAKQLA